MISQQKQLLKNSSDAQPIILFSYIELFNLGVQVGNISQYLDTISNMFNKQNTFQPMAQPRAPAVTNSLYNLQQ